MVFILKDSGYINANFYPCYFVLCLLVIQLGFMDGALFEMRENCFNSKWRLFFKMRRNYFTTKGSSSLQSCCLCPEQPCLDFSDSEQCWEKLMISSEGRKVSVADSAVHFSVCKMALTTFTNEH